MLISETCLFGDQPYNLASTSQTCSELIEADPIECYNKGEECCETCAPIAELYTNLTSKDFCKQTIFTLLLRQTDLRKQGRLDQTLQNMASD